MGWISKVNKNKTTKVSHNAAKYIINRNDLWSPKQKQTTNEIPQITPEANKPSPNILSKTKSTKTLNNIEVTPIESSNNIELPTPEIHGASTIQFAPDAAYSSTKHMWQTKQSKRWFDFEKIKATLENYVKYELFHNLKFISCPLLMHYSNEPKSLCQVVCKKMNVEHKDQEGFWHTYSHVIEKKI